MGKKTPKIPVDDYYMSVHAGVCYPPDEVVDLRIDEKTVFEGSYTGNATIFKSDRYLFGGDQKEGGISGVIELMFGGVTQLLSDASASRFGLTGATAPGFRGYLSIFFRGAELAEATVPTPGSIAAALAPFIPRKGFLWGSNSPYVPRAFDLRVRRASKGLSALYQDIVIDGYKHVNPAHMLYELQTNTEFGAGMSDTQIDLASFEAAAVTLYNEGIGLSALWLRERQVEEFCQDILNHINGMMYVDPATGKMTLTLTRDDYVVAELPVYGPEVLTVTDFERKTRGEIVNSFTVTYTNPITGEEASVTAVDEAGIAMQGDERVEGSQNYYMVNHADLAYALAERDLRIGAQPLAKGTCVATRELSSIRPGDVFVLDYPELDLTDGAEVVCRVTKVDQGKSGAPDILIYWTEDVFVVPVAVQRAREPSRWISPSEAPAPLAYQDAFTLPYVMASQVPQLQLDDTDYPDVVVGLLGDQTGQDTQGFAIFADTVDTVGDTVAENLGLVPLSDRITLSAPLAAEASTVTVSLNAPDRYIPAKGDMVMIGEAEAISELILITSDPSTVGGITTFSANRGVLDTTPKAHVTGTTAWLIPQDFSSWDIQPRTATVEVDYTLLTKTSQGILDEGSAVVLPYTPVDRPYAPSRPADVTVGGSAFATVEYVTDPATIDVTWANRNRLTEDAVILAWDDATVAGEAGQTTVIEIVDTLGVVYNTIDSLTGTSHTLAIGDFGPGEYYYVRVLSERDGIRSFQGHEILVHFQDRSGYGSAYGSAYGA